MKRIGLALLTLGLILIAPPMAMAKELSPNFAEENIASANAPLKSAGWQDFSLKAGFKEWQTTMETKDIDTGSMVLGAAVNLAYRNTFYIDLSYYAGSDFDDSTHYNFDNSQNVPSDYSAENSDLDIRAGYYLHPRISAFLGLKRSTLDLEIRSKIEDDTKIDMEESYTGPVVGVAVNYPITKSGVVLLGTAGYAFLRAEREWDKVVGGTNGLVTENDSQSFDMRGPVMELLFSFSFRKLPRLGLIAGYKYQNYENPENSDDYLTYSGITFGLNWRFF